MDTNEERRRKKRERYAQMKDEEKQEQLKRRREDYQKRKLKEPKKYAELEPEKQGKIREQERQRYADRKPEQKKARVEQITANKVLKRSMPCKESIAMRNPAYNTTEHKGRVSTLNVRQKNQVTPGERQTLLHRRNEEFSTKKRKTGSVSAQEDISVINSDTEDKEPLKHPEVLINGKSNFLCNTTTLQ